MLEIVLHRCFPLEFNVENTGKVNLESFLASVCPPAHIFLCLKIHKKCICLKEPDSSHFHSRWTCCWNSWKKGGNVAKNRWSARLQWSSDFHELSSYISLGWRVFLVKESLYLWEIDSLSWIAEIERIQLGVFPGSLIQVCWHYQWFLYSQRGKVNYH